MNLQKISDSEHKITMVMSREEIDKYFNEILKEETKKLTIPGFRKGKAPISVVKKMYGDALFVENLDKIVNNRFWDEIDVLGIDVIGTPTITKLEKAAEGGLTFEIHFETQPEFELAKLEDIEIEKREFLISDETIQNVLKRIQFDKRSEKEIDKVESRNSIVEFSFYPLDATEDQSKPIKIPFYLGEGEKYEELIQILLNRSKDEEFETELNIPKILWGGEEQFSQEPKIKYIVKIEKIKQIELPSIDDDLAKKYLNDENANLETLKEKIRQDYLNYYKTEEERIINDKIKSKLIEIHNFTPPTSIVEKFKENISKRIREKKEPLNLPPEEIDKIIDENAKLGAKWFFIESAIMKKFGVQLTQAEIEEEAKRLSEKYNIEMEKVMSYLRDKSEYLYELEQSKLFSFLNSKIKIKTVEEIL